MQQYALHIAGKITAKGVIQMRMYKKRTRSLFDIIYNSIFSDRRNYTDDRMSAEFDFTEKSSYNKHPDI